MNRSSNAPSPNPQRRKEDIEAIYPATSVQHGMLFHSLLDPALGVFVEQIACTLEGALDLAAFEASWQSVLARHGILRTSFFWDRLEEPLQIVSRQVTVPVSTPDWRSASSDEQDARWRKLLAEDRERGFDFTVAPLIRLTLARTAEDRWRFLWTFHHILLDGWSFALVLRDVFSYYDAFSTGRELTLEPSPPFRSYVSWLQSRDVTRAERYWREYLQGLEPAPPSAGGGASPLSAPSAKLPVVVPESTTSALRALARQGRLTLNTLVQGAWGLLLGRYRGLREVIFGTVVSGRPTELPGVEEMVGVFINALPTRVKFPAEVRVIDWLQALQLQNAAMRDHEFVPMAEMLKWSEALRGLLDTLVVFENYPVEEVILEPRRNLAVHDYQYHSQDNYSLTLYVAEGADAISGSLEYSTALYSRAEVIDLVDKLNFLLTSIATSPGSRLGDISLLGGAERTEVTATWNATSRDFPADRCMHQLVEQRAEATPDATAVTLGARSLTFAELNEQANQLASYLRSCAVSADACVAVCLERSLEMAVALLGVLKAGAAYLPLDPIYPKERLAFMLSDSCARVLVTQQRLVSDLPTGELDQVVCLDADGAELAERDRENSPSRTLPDNLAYVMYTSGSTGTPKGVAVSHRSMVNHSVAVAREFGLRSNDRVLQFASLGFDTSVEEIFPAWVVGATVVLVHDNVLASAELLQFIRSEGLTVLDLPTAFWREWAAELSMMDEPLPGCVRLVVVGGEKVTAEAFGSWQETAGSARWINTYGPTEATIIATLYEHRETAAPSVAGFTPPIGRPIANVETYVLDPDLNPLPPGIPGELHIGGAGLARGYAYAPGLTAGRFIPNPFGDAEGARLYRTGDRVRYASDGTIEFLGRMDRQFKLRGVRIEPGEVEATLELNESVREALVVPREDDDGVRGLVAYVVPRDGRAVDVEQLRGWARERLAEHMVPTTYLLLDRFPLTASGKIDRAALPVPEDRPESADALALPRTPTEEALTAIAAEVLGVERVGVHDNFFELGGHSLLATQAISRIRHLFEVDLPLRVLFDAPTVAGLARAVEDAQRTGTGVDAPPVRPAARDGGLPLSFAQQRLWFLDQLIPDNPSYNTPGALRVLGELDVEALKRSLDAIVGRHEVLRTTFAMRDGRATQVIAPLGRVELPCVDLSGVEVPERWDKAWELVNADALRPFDLTVGPLLRVQLLRLAEDDHVLMYNMHHIISDGWSMGVIVEELATLYPAFVAGGPVQLPPLPIQYADFAIWQREWLRGAVLDAQLSYWKVQLEGLPAFLELPTDRPRPPVQSFWGGYLPVTVPAEIAAELRTLSRKRGVTLFMTLLTAFEVFLYRYSGQSDFAIGSPIANRNRAEIEPLIGFFVNTLVLRADLSGDPTFSDLLVRTKEVTLGAYAHQDLPFEQLVTELQPARDLSHAPLFQVMFALHNAPVRAIELPTGLQFAPLEQAPSTPEKIEARAAKFDLTLDLIEQTDRSIRGVLEYNTDLFDAETAARLVACFERLLESIAAAPRSSDCGSRDARGDRVPPAPRRVEPGEPEPARRAVRSRADRGPGERETRRDRRRVRARVAHLPCAQCTRQRARALPAAPRGRARGAGGGLSGAVRPADRGPPRSPQGRWSICSAQPQLSPGAARLHARGCRRGSGRHAGGARGAVPGKFGLEPSA